MAGVLDSAPDSELDFESLLAQADSQSAPEDPGAPSTAQDDDAAPEAPSDDAPTDADDEESDGSESTGAHDDDDDGESSASADDPDIPEPIKAALASAKPLTYTVDGQERTFEGIDILDDGAIIDKDVLPLIQQRLSERDHLFERSQQTYQQYQALERATRFTTVGADGTPTELVGAPAIEAQRIELARTTAQRDALLPLLRDPNLYFSMLAEDANGNLVFNQGALENLILKADLAERDAVQRAREQFQAALAPPSMASRPVEEQVPEFWASVQQYWLPAYKGLTPDDHAILQAAIPRYLRPAKPQEIAAGAAAPGDLILDDKYKTEVLDRFANRLSGMTQTATSAKQIQKENQAKLAAAKQPVATGKPKSPTPPRDRSTGQFVSAKQKHPDIMAILERGELPDLSGDI